ncbi:MAG: hypothetical protein PHY90_09320 [Desulfitobacteriaceae bacterium]|jgi:hypothetical protein|nr:hypothetical protein [Desulfitobacteriaceae bacterium]
MRRQCKYEKCKMDAQKGSDYCKYHIRIMEILNELSPELRKVYERIKKERYG